MAKNEFKDAEALGKIKTAKEEKQEEFTTQLEQSEAVIDTPDKFQAAIGNAQLDGIEYIEVEERLFKHLIKNSKTSYLTYGNPGIKVYKRGTREEIEGEERMSAEQRHEFLAKKRQAHA